MKVGIYVGSFDPPHNGHSDVALEILEKNICDKIFFVPTSSYWDKKMNSSIFDRKDMLDIVSSSINDKCGRSRASNVYYGVHNLYTYEILRQFRKKYSDLYLIIGADNICKFYEWKNVREIIDNYHIIVVGRDNININQYIKEEDREKFIFVPFDMKISSTDIREDLGKGNDPKGLNPKILRLIENRGLYGRNN